MWNVYLNDELQFTSTSPFMDLNDQAFLNWDFGHVDPTGAQTGGADRLYTAGDLAAAMALNPYLKVFSANGYYDAVTPFFQTVLNFENMPLSDPHARNNSYDPQLSIRPHGLSRQRIEVFDAGGSCRVLRRHKGVFPCCCRQTRAPGNRAHQPFAIPQTLQPHALLSMTPIRQRCFNGSPHRPWAAVRRKLLCCGAVSASAPALPLHCSRRDWP